MISAVSLRPLYLIFQHLLGLLLLGRTSSTKDIELLVQAGTGAPRWQPRRRGPVSTGPGHPRGVDPGLDRTQLRGDESTLHRVCRRHEDQLGHGDALGVATGAAGANDV